MELDAMSGGFATPAIQSAQAFRVALDVMARPGMIRTLDGRHAPAPLSVAAATLLLTLSDRTTPVHLAASFDTTAVRDWLTFHTGAPLVDARRAPTLRSDAGRICCRSDRFRHRHAGLSRPLGHPDRRNAESSKSEGLRLVGPGIKDDVELTLPGDGNCRVSTSRSSRLGSICF